MFLEQIDRLTMQTPMLETKLRNDTNPIYNLILGNIIESTMWEVTCIKKTHIFFTFFPLTSFIVSLYNFRGKQLSQKN